MFKWYYEQHLYTHTLIPIINGFASTNEPLKIAYRYKLFHVVLFFYFETALIHLVFYFKDLDNIYHVRVNLLISFLPNTLQSIPETVYFVENAIKLTFCD